MRPGALLLVLALLGMGCGHSRSSAPRRAYVISENTQGVGGSGGRDCHQEHLQCFDRCWNSAPPYPHKKGDGWHHEYCTRTCREAYMECVREQGDTEQPGARRTLRFVDIDGALAWLRAHETEVALGTVVIVAGVAFVVTSGGSGVLLLAPLTL